MPELVCRFAEALRLVLGEHTPAGLDARWESVDLDAVGWVALARARQADVTGWEAALDEVDGLLLRLLDRLRAFGTEPGALAAHVMTFRLPALERLQHATAAVLVAHRYGSAGFRTVIADTTAPLGRRYFAFLTLAQRHPSDAWPLFERYLTPDAHHAFLGVAAEAARFYSERGAACYLMDLFQAVRSDLHLRAFLSPRILESLYVLDDPATLPFFRELLVTGHTDPHPQHCEVTRALVMVRRFTGRLEPNTKFSDVADADVLRTIAEAEVAFEGTRELLSPVVVI